MYKILEAIFEADQTGRLKNGGLTLRYCGGTLGIHGYQCYVIWRVILPKSFALVDREM